VDAKQTYIVDSVRLALSNFNDFLNENEVDFALRPDQFEALTFVFGAKDKPHLDLEIRLSDAAIPDDYQIGRVLGRVYHEVHNPKFKTSKERPEKIHVGRIIEHSFAMLHIRSKDSSYDLDDILADYSSAKDSQLQYTLLNEEEDPLDKKTSKGGKSPLEKALDNAREERAAEEKHKKKDAEFKVDDYIEQQTKEDFEVPELQGYKGRELGGDDPFTATLAKMKNEAFNTAKTIIEGKDGEENWKRTLASALYKDVDDAKKYLAGILGY